MVGTTRQSMIDTAMRLFQRDGYAATSWRGLVREAGTPWGSVQHHFPGGKEQLAVAAVEHGAALVATTITEAFKRHETTEEAIAWWFGRAAVVLSRSDFQHGCPVATLALEKAHESGPLADAVRQAFDRWLDQLAAALRADGHSSNEAAEVAVQVLGALEGALIVARVRRDTSVIALAARSLATVLTPPRARTSPA